eukprot:scaffold39121_cov16-Tisochrysis_lutea.AAC.1
MVGSVRLLMSNNVKMRELNLDVQLYPPVEQQRIMVHSRPKGLLRQRKGFQNAGISCSQFPVTTRASFMLAHMPVHACRWMQALCPAITKTEIE